MAASRRDGDSAAGELLSAIEMTLVDSRFSFLRIAHADLLNEILARRSSTLLERIRQANSVSRSDAEEITSVISDEFTNPRRRLGTDRIWSDGQCRARAVQRGSPERMALTR